MAIDRDILLIPLCLRCLSGPVSFLVLMSEVLSVSCKTNVYFEEILANISEFKCGAGNG